MATIIDGTDEGVVFIGVLKKQLKHIDEINEIDERGRHGEGGVCGDCGNGVPVSEERRR